VAMDAILFGTRFARYRQRASMKLGDTIGSGPDRRTLALSGSPIA